MIVNLAELLRVQAELAGHLHVRMCEPMTFARIDPQLELRRNGGLVLFARCAHGARVVDGPDNALRHDEAVHRGTAVRRLRTIAQRCQQVSGIWQEEPMLLSAWAFGSVLDHADAMPAVQVAFVLRLPADELTWCAEPQSCSGLPSVLEIDKAPVGWYWRPEVWPVSNHVIRRPLRIWSLDGLDSDALDALSRREAEPYRLPAPPREQEAEQLIMELEASLAHLRRVKDGFWERNWRSAHKGLGIHPENHLWDAAHGYLDLLAAVGTAPTREP